jgi:molybdopterin-guanine dinucleotide biosynthesis protein MobB
MDQIVVGVVGSKNSGKSTFISKCSTLLSNLGQKVAIIKFSHSKFTIDPQTKDSLLFHDSQAIKYIFSGPFEQVTYQKVQKRGNPQELLLTIGRDIDIVFCESYPNDSPIIPLIFTIKNYNDYLETKNRYKDQKPIFITGKDLEVVNDQIENVPVLSIDQKAHRSEIKQKIFDSNPLRL